MVYLLDSVLMVHGVHFHELDVEYLAKLVDSLNILYLQLALPAYQLIFKDHY